jgi:hypothetical protein
MMVTQAPTFFHDILTLTICGIFWNNILQIPTVTEKKEKGENFFCQITLTLQKASNRGCITQKISTLQRQSLSLAVLEHKTCFFKESNWGL